MKKTVKDIDVTGKKVIVRCDFNVPLNERGKITDDIRITSAIPTISYLIEQKASVILMSHLGRPKGQADMKYTLKPVADHLSKLLKQGVIFIDAPEVVNDEVKKVAETLKAGDVMLLENVRFRKEETKNEESFSKELAELAEIFVNDAFGTAHRAHSSTAGIADFLPAVSGFLIEKELKFLGEAVESPKRPFVAILGGAKVADKILVIDSLLNKVDTLIIGGGMAYTFLKAKGYEVGISILDQDSIGLAKELLNKAQQKGVNFVLPIDMKAAKEFNNDAPAKEFDADQLPMDYMGLDIGNKSIALFVNEIKNGSTIVWNGPVGVFEMSNFAEGTFQVAQALADNQRAITIIGGGDSAAAVAQFGLSSRMTHISTGGGASLEFLEGKELPGVACLQDQ